MLLNIKYITIYQCSYVCNLKYYQKFSYKAEYTDNDGIRYMGLFQFLLTSL